MACCELCGCYETMESAHSHAQAEIYDHFAQQLYFAKLELSRLTALFTDVSWYAFELECSTWKYPWPQSVGSSMVMLCGARHDRRTTHYPVYYAGRLDRAPPVPPELILREIALAKRWVEECEERCDDVYDYAPGGDKHQALVRKYLTPSSAGSTGQSPSTRSPDASSRPPCRS